MTFKHKQYKIEQLSSAFIDKYPKCTNLNGCWIPPNIPTSTGHVQIMIEGKKFLLHRLAYCIVYAHNYYDNSFVIRHGEFCNPACFNYMHLTKGTQKDNVIDSVRHKTHVNARKDKCYKCNKKYSSRVIKSGRDKGTIVRYCRLCSNDWNNKQKL